MKARSDKLLVLVIVLVLGGVFAGFFVGGHTYKPLTQENFASSISKAATNEKSMHLTMAGAKSTVSADFSFVDPAMQISMIVNIDGKEQKLNMKVIGSASYVQIQSSKWAQLGSSGSTTAATDQFKNLGASSLANQFESGLKSVEYVGQTTVNGELVRHYTIVMAAGQLSGILNALAETNSAFKGMDTVTEQVYLSDQNLIRRWELTLPSPASTTAIDYAWNVPVTIVAPAASDLLSLPNVPTPTPSATPTQ